MGRKPSEQGPRFVAYFVPVIEALKQLGGSARPAEVRERVAQNLKLSEKEQARTLPSGILLFDNMVAWARQYLVYAGYIDSSKWCVWTLTDKGRTSRVLEHQDALRIFKEVRGRIGSESSEAGEDDAQPEGDSANDDYRQQVLRILKDLPPAGFERFC